MIQARRHDPVDAWRQRRVVTLIVCLTLGFGAMAVGTNGSVAPSPARAQGYQPPPGPRVMLCLFDDRGRLLAGNLSCPGRVRPRDAMMPQAHCFYDMRGYLWRGLPRCPPHAPPFLMDEASQALGSRG